MTKGLLDEQKRLKNAIAVDRYKQKFNDLITKNKDNIKLFRVMAQIFNLDPKAQKGTIRTLMEAKDYKKKEVEETFNFIM